MHTRFLLIAASFALAGTACTSGSEPTVDALPTNPGAGAAAGACLVGDPNCLDNPAVSGPAPCLPGEANCEITPPPQDTRPLQACDAIEPDCDDTIEVEPIDVVREFETEPELVTPQPGQTNDARNVFVQEAIATDTGIRVAFFGGVSPCFVVDTATAVETADSVVITVTAGDQFSSRDTACIEIAKYYAVDIALDAALDGRELLATR